MKQKPEVGWQLFNLTKKTLVAENTRVASTFFGRLRGLIGYKSLPAGEALMLVPCRSIHTCLMAFPIDVLFLDRGMNVLQATTLKPWRFSPVVKEAWRVLELPAGSLACSNTTPGDRLVWMESRPAN